METFKVNKFWRSYTSGKPLSNDFRMHIIENILAEGGDRLSGYIHLTYAELSTDFRPKISEYSQKYMAPVLRGVS